MTPRDSHPEAALGRRAPLAASLALASVLLAAGLPGAAGAHPGSTLDPSLKLHPLLQVGAQQEPDKTVRVLVQKAHPDDDGRAIAHGVGAAVQEEFGLANALLLEVPQGRALALAHDPHVRFVSLDSPTREHSGGSGATAVISTSNLLTLYPELDNANNVWNNGNPTIEATGSGVAVAVLDTGINDQHADFRTSTLKSVNVNKSPSTLGTADGHGHGTHVAGIINGRSSSGTYIGVAPGATVYSVKVADDTGRAHESDLLRGLQWVYDNRATTGIRAVNLSITSSTPESYKTSVVDAAVEQLWFNGIAVVAAVGNHGSDSNATWYAPANDPYVITVGATDDNGTFGSSDDTLAAFSSRGRTQDGVYKPDLVASGRRIYAPLAAANSVIAQQFPTRISADGQHIRLSGTSMAAPQVAGAIALLLQKVPTLTPDQIKGALVNTTKGYGFQPDSAGELNAQNLLSTSVAGTRYAANVGLVPNSGINLSTGTVAWGSAYWDSAYWDSAYWDSAYWDVAASYD